MIDKSETRNQKSEGNQKSDPSSLRCDATSPPSLSGSFRATSEALRSVAPIGNRLYRLLLTGLGLRFPVAFELLRIANPRYSRNFA
jgi:hypothetical protein